MDIKKILIDGCKQINVNLEETQANSILKYKDLLLEWNQNVNLTAITEEKEVIIKHFIDSLTILNFINISDKKIIDIGTGAGFPGLPLKIVEPSIKITLLDSLNKRINVLKEIIKQLNIDHVNLIHGRAEDYGIIKDYREKFDICTSRAVANLAVLCEYSLPFVKVGGTFIGLKGPQLGEELNQAQNAITVLGGQIERIEKIQLPFTDITHSIIFVKKIKQCPSNYPRKAGKPSKNPII